MRVYVSVCVVLCLKKKEAQGFPFGKVCTPYHARSRTMICGDLVVRAGSAVTYNVAVPLVPCRARETEHDTGRSVLSCLCLAVPEPACAAAVSDA